MVSATAFTLFCLVCTVLAFTRHPIWGVYFYLATTYIYPPGRWWGYMFGDLRWALLSAAITALAVMFHRGKLQAKPLWLATGPSSLLLLVSAGGCRSKYPGRWTLTNTSGESSSWSNACSAMWFVYRTLDSKERLTDLMFAHVLGCALLGVFAPNDGSRERQSRRCGRPQPRRLQHTGHVLW